MSDTAPRTAEQQRVAEAWGEPFVALVANPRLDFSGEAIGVRLWKPILVNGTAVEVLMVREPTLGQLQLLDRISGEMARTQRLLMQVAGLTEKEAGTLGLRDVTLFGRLLESFTLSARGTGA